MPQMREISLSLQIFQAQDAVSKTHPATKCSRELDDILSLHVHFHL